MKSKKWEIIFKTDLLFDVDNGEAFLMEDDLSNRLQVYVGRGLVRIKCRDGMIQIERIK